MLLPYYFSWTWLLLIPGLVLTLWAQWKVSSTYKRYSEVPSARGLTGGQGARMLLDSAGLSGVGIEVINGRLSDNYDPRSKTLRLSADVANSNSLAALGVAAHETGHARAGRHGILVHEGAECARAGGQPGQQPGHDPLLRRAGLLPQFAAC